MGREIEQRDLAPRECRHLGAGRRVFGERLGKLHRAVRHHAGERLTRHHLGDRAHAQNGTAGGLDFAARPRLSETEHDRVVPAHGREHEAGRAGTQPHHRTAHGRGVLEHDIVGARRRGAGKQQDKGRG